MCCSSYVIYAYKKSYVHNMHVGMNHEFPSLFGYLDYTQKHVMLIELRNNLISDKFLNRNSHSVKT